MISRGPSSAGSTMQPARRCRYLSGQRFWLASRGRSPTQQFSTLFGMRRSFGGEGLSSAYARLPGLKLEQRGKAIKCENILGRYSQIRWLFWRKIRYSQAKMVPDMGRKPSDTGLQRVAVAGAGRTKSQPNVRPAPRSQHAELRMTCLEGVSMRVRRRLNETATLPRSSFVHGR